MSTWTCTLCNATGEQNSPAAARRAYAAHYAREHQEEDW